MQRRTPIFTALTIAALTAGQTTAADIPVESAQVRLIDDVEIPAQVEGVLKSVEFKEGQVVGEGDPVAQLDDAEAKLQRDRAQIDLDVATKVAANDAKVQLAQKAVEDARLAVDRAKLDLLIARKQAENDVKIRLARKTSGVAASELERAVKTRLSIADAVSQSEIDMLQLSLDKTTLEIEQAELELDIARLTLNVQQAELDRLQLGIDTAKLDEVQAKHELEIADDDRRVKANGLETSQLKLDRRRIVSPVSGVVAKVFHHRGEWVEPGETVMRIVRMDRLRIEGFVNAADLAADMNGLPATITAKIGDNPKARFTGEVVFISPEIDPVNNQVRVWAEVDNPKLQLRPGMRVQMTIGGGKSYDE